MLEDEILTPLNDILAARGRFGHREHLELAWTYLEGSSLDVAQWHVARLHGDPDRFHATMTSSWLCLVCAHRRKFAGVAFDGFIARNGALLDQTLLDHHYSAEVLSSPHARSEWAMPDLRPLPLDG